MGNSHKNLFLRNHWANCNQTLVVSKWFQTRRFLWEFPIGSYVELSSAVAAILVGSLKCQTKIWKGITQGSFDGRQAKNRKRGDEIKNKSSPL
jgi:hypothetical protein